MEELGMEVWTLAPVCGGAPDFRLLSNFYVAVKLASLPRAAFSVEHMLSTIAMGYGMRVSNLRSTN